MQDYAYLTPGTVTGSQYCIYFICIYPHNSQENFIGLYFRQAITPTSFWRSQDIAVRLKFLFVFLIFIRSGTGILSHLLRPPSREKYRNVFFPMTQQNDSSKF